MPPFGTLLRLGPHGSVKCVQRTRDTKFTRTFDRRLAEKGVRVVRNAYPND